MRSVAARTLLGLLLQGAAAGTLALGTDAGTVITNTATLSFEVDGASQPLVESASVAMRVDERLDATTVSRDGGLVLVASPAPEATASFEVTNTGNGAERYRLTVETDIDEGGFDPLPAQIYIESNGVPGLQTGAGGDHPYIGGADDPELGSDQTIVVHVVSEVPAALGAGAQGAVRLSAVARTIVDAVGVDTPDDAAFPAPGADFTGLGDDGVVAVVGRSNAAAAGTISAETLLQVDGPVLSFTKTALSVDDGEGGSRVISGARVVYELAVEVQGSGAIDAVVLNDPLPENIAYEAGSLALDGVAQDDDFLPVGSDGAGFDGSRGAITVDIGRLVAGAPERRVTFAATVR